MVVVEDNGRDGDVMCAVRFREAGPGLTVITVTATFRGHMNASQLLRKQNDIQETGFFYGFINFAIQSFIPAKPGKVPESTCLPSI